MPNAMKVTNQESRKDIQLCHLVFNPISCNCWYLGSWWKKKICEVYGSYMGYMDFNGQRYFDIRHNEDIYYPIILDGETALESDSTKREDSVTLAAGDQDAAQKRKEELEEL